MPVNHIDIQGQLRMLLLLSHLGDVHEMHRIHGKTPVAVRTMIARMVMAGGNCGQAGLKLLAFLSEDDYPEVRAMAFTSLGRYRGYFPEWLIEKIIRIQEPDPWVELFRIRLFRKRDDFQANHLLIALKHSASFPQAWIQRETILTLEMSNRFTDSISMSGFMTWLAHDNAHVRETALRFLYTQSQFVDDEWLGAICRSSRDTSHLVRKSCAAMLSKHVTQWPDRILPRLKAMSRDQTHWSIRLAIIRGISCWYDHSPASALEIIRVLIGDPVRIVRLSALRQLRRLARTHPELTLHLVRLWYHADKSRRDALNMCLEEAANSEAV